jgi:predicted DNA-binding transcriptional regulator YafY
MAENEYGQPKKMINIEIFDILKKYTDQDHRLSQKQIQELLLSEFGADVDRKTIRRNLMDLEAYLDLHDSGPCINYDSQKRSVPSAARRTGKLQKNSAAGKETAEENDIRTGFYLEREFSDSELRLLIDSVLYSSYIPSSQCADLVKKLEHLSNRYFQNRCRYIDRGQNSQAGNSELFLNIELLDEAISRKKKVTFHYLEYQTDKKLHKRRRSDGSIRSYLISPYQMVIREGKYYLICNYEDHDNVANYRIDRITDLEITEEEVRPFSKLKWSAGGDLTVYMKNHPYMVASGIVHAKLWVSRSAIGDLIDTFGCDVNFEESREEPGGVIASFDNTELAVIEFAKRMMPRVKVISPDTAKNHILEDIQKYMKEPGSGSDS